MTTGIYLLEGLLETIPYEKKCNDAIEQVFIFAVMWAFGGPMVVDKAADYRKQFHETFTTLFGQANSLRSTLSLITCGAERMKCSSIGLV